MTTTVPQIVEVDCSTGEAVTRDMTAEELAAMEAQAADAAAKRAADAAEAEAKAAAKASATDKLAKLGLTEEEIAALRG
jgi:hypothetical protein